MEISGVVKKEEDISTEEFLRPISEHFSTAVPEEVKGETPIVLFCTEAEIESDDDNCESSNQKEDAEEEQQHNDDYILGLPSSSPQIISDDQTNYRLISDGKRNRFECDICKRTFLELQSLQNHRKRHGKRQQASKKDQVTSRLQIDAEKIRFECSICKRTFLDLQFLQKHQKSHEKRPKISAKNHAKSPVQSDDETILFECKICNKIFSELRFLRAHYESHKNSSHKCRACGKEYLSSTELSSHEIYHFYPMTFECNICKETFSGLMTLKRHIKEHKMKSSKCGACSKTFSSPNDLKSHKRVHLKSTSFECDICDQSFVSLIHLKRHVPSHNKKLYKCFPCGKTFVSLNQLETHEAVHLTSESFRNCVCGFCSKKFLTFKNLRIHLRKSHKKPYNCTTCGKNFPFPKDLKTAYQTLKLHPKYFECDICKRMVSKIHSEQELQPEHNSSNKSCSTTGLKEILQIESEEKQFKCSVCRKAFATSFGLQCHNMMHSKETAK